MKIFTKWLFRPDLRLPIISKFKLIVGLIGFISASLIFYSFAFVIFEGLRISSISFDYSVWEPSEKTMNFLKFFGACFSVILAQSFTLSFFLNTNKRPFSKFNYKRKMIINDQRMFSWYFINWVFRFFTILAIIFLLTFRKSYYTVTFLSEYRFLFILILIVIFLNSWLNIRSIKIKRRLLVILANAAFVFIFSFLLSQINIIDYKKLNLAIEKNKPADLSNMQFPKCNLNDNLRAYSFMHTIILEYPGDTIEAPKLVFEHNKLSFQDIENEIKNALDFNDEFSLIHSYFRIFIDIRVKMKYLNELKRTISKFGIYKICYAVIPKDPVYDINYYDNYVNSYINAPHRAKQFDIREDVKTFKKIKVKFENGLFYINDSITKKDDLKLELRRKAFFTDNYIFLIKVEDEMQFGEYFTMWSTIVEGVRELQDDYAFEKYQVEFDWLDNEKQEKIIDKYPLRYLEVTEEYNDIFESD